MSKRVALYVRVSTEEQSTELQERELLAYAQARGWMQVEVYCDKSTGTNGNRLALKRLLADARSRRVDIVMCWKFDRLFRSLKDLVLTLQELQELGIEFVSFKDNLDLTTATGRLHMQLLGAFAEFEASLIRERVKAGLANARANGKRLGKPPIEVDAELARSLRREGKSLRVIGKALGVSKDVISKVVA